MNHCCLYPDGWPHGQDAHGPEDDGAGLADGTGRGASAKVRRLWRKRAVGMSGQSPGTLQDGPCAQGESLSAPAAAEDATLNSSGVKRKSYSQVIMAVSCRVGNLDRTEGMSQFRDIWALSREGWRLAPSGGLLPRWFLSWMAASGQLNCSHWAQSSQCERFKQHRWGPLHFHDPASEGTSLTSCLLFFLVLKHLFILKCYKCNTYCCE